MTETTTKFNLLTLRSIKTDKSRDRLLGWVLSHTDIMRNYIVSGNKSPFDFYITDCGDGTIKIKIDDTVHHLANVDKWKSLAEKRVNRQKRPDGTLIRTRVLKKQYSYVGATVPAVQEVPAVREEPE